MVLIESYGLAMFACTFCMICWGSWSNTQKLAAKNWRFELFYWDYVIGLVLTALLWGFTFGSFGDSGQSFWSNVTQASGYSIRYAMLGGIVWNIGNLLFVAAIALAGMAVAFPIGGGIAWLGGILFNYIIENEGAKMGTLPKVLLFTGFAIIFIAIYLCMVAYKRLATHQQKPSTLGIVLSVLAGLFFAFFYGLVVKSFDPEFVAGTKGNFIPYSGTLFFTLGALASTIVLNPIAMRFPVQGDPVTFKQYFSGAPKNHLTGLLGGLIWASGMAVSFMAIKEADPAVGYAISNASPVVAVLWGVFIWKEFKDAPKGTNRILAIMFGLFLVALVVIGASKKIGADTGEVNPADSSTPAITVPADMDN